MVSKITGKLKEKDDDADMRLNQKRDVIVLKGRNLKGKTESLNKESNDRGD